MTEPKTMQLAPADWKQLCLLNVAQLHGYIDSIPPHNEGGTSALTDETVAMIDAHLERGRSLLRAWRVARVPQMMASEQSHPAAVNGTEPPKRRGGWTKGKKRTPRVPREAPQ